MIAILKVWGHLCFLSSQNSFTFARMDMNVKAIEDILEPYDAVCFDAYGVLNNYKGLIPGINETIDFLEKNGKQSLVLTNDASRNPEDLADKYQKRGIHALGPEKIISSGMLAQEYMRHKVTDGLVAYLGTEQSKYYIESLGLNAISIREIDFERLEEISALVFLDDEGFDWDTDLSKTVNLLRKTNIPTIVANTDLKYPVSKSNVNIAIGAIANMIEGIVGKRFLRFGKPDTQMFLFAYQRLVAQQYVEKHKVLMVGDTLETDILGGNKFGFDTALVLTGNTQAHKAELRIRSKGIIPTYVIHSAGMGA